MTLLFLYIIFLVVVYAFQIKGNADNVKIVLLVTCLILVCLAGTRDVYKWADTDSYVICLDNTPTLSEFNLSSEPSGYRELGFYWLSIIIKTFSSSYVFYFFVIAAISIWYIYKGLNKYCCYPLLGLAIYIARFFAARNMMQIRSGLAYAIVFYGLRYITRRDWKRYFLIVLIAYQFHHSVLIAVPLYFITYIKIRKWHVVVGLIVAFILGGFFQEPLQAYVTDQMEDLDKGLKTYTQGGEIEQAKGLKNPLIYFQSLILLIYTFAEKKIKKIDANYYSIRAAYLYSTMILISFCMFVALSSRTSTLFATLEIIILPSLLKGYGKKYYDIGYILLSMGITAIFYMNYFGK